MVLTRRTRILPLLTWRSAICDSGMAPTTRHVALTLSLYMNERGGSAHPGAVKLAGDTGYSERTVRDHLAILTAEGWLALVEEGGLKGHKRIANEYRATIPDGFTTPEPPAGVDPNTAPGGRLSPTPAADSSTPAPGSPVTTTTPAAASGVPLQLTALTPAAASPHLFKNSPEEFPLSSTATATATRPDPDGATEEEDPRLAGVWPVLADLRLRRRQGDPIRDHARWKATVARKAADELAATAVDLVARYPGISTTDLAEALDDPTAPVLARYPRARCLECDNVGVRETPDGCVPCESCRPVLTGGAR